LHLVDQKVSWSQFNQAVCALRFLYNTTLKRPHLIEHLPFAKRPRILPDVLTREEVSRLLEAALPGRDHAVLETLYSCGLRLRELLALQVADVDSVCERLPATHNDDESLADCDSI
jgi:site-specific recombinase XerD